MAHHWSSFVAPCSKAMARPRTASHNPTMAKDLDPLSRLLAERDCQRLIIELVRRLDLGVSGSAADLFTTDGLWEWPRGSRRIQGREQLRAYFGSRPADRKSRRLCTNVLVHVESPTRAQATSYLVTYRVDGWSDMVPAPAPTSVGHYEDHFVRIDGVWLLARRMLELPFGGPTARL